MTIWLLLTISIPAVVFVIEARPDFISKWWCDHVHRNQGHTGQEHHGEH